MKCILNLILFLISHRVWNFQEKFKSGKNRSSNIGSYSNVNTYVNDKNVIL